MDFSHVRTIYYPKESVEEKYRSGGLDTMAKNLMLFVERHVDAIIHLAIEHKSKGVPTCFMEATKELIRYKGGLHLPSEMADLIREMQKEVWYRGEEGISDARAIEVDWQVKYSSQWRQARLIEAEFLVDTMQDDVLRALGQKHD